MIVSPAHAAANSNASDLKARAVAVSNATASPVHPNIDASNAIAMRAAQNENDMNATDLPVLHADTEWIATASPARPSVATSMVLGLLVRHVLLSIRV